MRPAYEVRCRRCGPEILSVVDTVEGAIAALAYHLEICSLEVDVGDVSRDRKGYVEVVPIRGRVQIASGAFATARKWERSGAAGMLNAELVEEEPVGHVLGEN